MNTIHSPFYYPSANTINIADLLPSMVLSLFLAELDCSLSMVGPPTP